eukprot:4093427-Amphidinium_carterae.1
MDGALFSIGHAMDTFSMTLRSGYLKLWGLSHRVRSICCSPKLPKLKNRFGESFTNAINLSRF